MEIQGVYWIEKSKSFSPLTDLLSVSAFEFTGFFVFKKSTINAFVSSNHPKIVALAKSSILFKNCLLFISLTELEKTFFYCFPKEVHLSPLNTDFLLQHVCLGPILRLWSYCVTWRGMNEQPRPFPLWSFLLLSASIEEKFKSTHHRSETVCQDRLSIVFSPLSGFWSALP